jgi:hypothetical protein
VRLPTARLDAEHFDRILRGGTPDTLPIGQPTKFGLIINVKIAKALGLTIPRSPPVRADEVFQWSRSARSGADRDLYSSSGRNWATSCGSRRQPSDTST